MTGYDPADYATIPGDADSVDLVCLRCRDTGNYNEQWIYCWIESQTATLAKQDTAAREHHQRYHGDPQCPSI